MSDTEIKNHNINEPSPSNEEDFQFNTENACEDTCSCATTFPQGEEFEEGESIVEDEPKEKKPNPQLDAFLLEMENLPHVEAKVRHALAFMENSLAQSGTPHFKTFWEVRNICLKLFKESLPPAVRTQLWTKYSELSKEARRLKELLDEQSSFAAEQIEIAIAALENDIENFEDQVSRLSPTDLGTMPKMFEKKIQFYQDLQKRLNLLNVQASRINGLRKELIKTEMRVRLKNKFFQRLSQAGDKIFPLRKDLIKEVSQAFSEDVDTFINTYFTKDFQDSLFILREEIKGLQSVAKVLTLNTHSFTHTRMCLSECWDKIKIAEKERKKERAQLKAVFKQNYDAVNEKILEFKKHYEAGEWTDDQANKQLDEISKFMRHVELGRDEIKALRDELQISRNQITEKLKTQEQQRFQQDQEREKNRKAKIDELKVQIETLGKNVRTMSAPEIAQARDELMEQTQNASMNKFEKQEIERLLKPLRSIITDALSEKEEQALLSLSDDDRQSIEQLKEVLKQRKERRQEIKNQLESLRKVAGTSGFDFEKAMNNNELINSEKERLEKINHGIKEIEDKIIQLQKKR